MTKKLYFIIILIISANITAGRMPQKPKQAASETVVKSIAVNPVPLGLFPIWSSAATELNATGMIWDDANLDGFIDLFIANGNDITLSPNALYYSKRGVIPLGANWLSANHRYSGHCAVGDINDDGFPEFVVSNYIGDAGFGSDVPVDMYLNENGQLAASPYWQSQDSMNSFSCALGDMDNDGDLDLAVATGDAYTANFTSTRVYENVDGQLSSLPVWKSASEMAALDVFWGDVDNDGDLDLAMATDRYGARIFTNQNGTLDSFPSWQSANSEPSNTLILSDINGDGWLDLVVAYNNQLGGNGYFCLYLNDGTGQIDQNYIWNSSSRGFGSGLSAYDYDNDGDMDLAAGRWFDYPLVYECLGDSFSVTPVWSSAVSSVVEEMAWVDVDADGVELFADTITLQAGKKLYYLFNTPLYSLDSITSDGQLLGYADFCHDLISGWVSLVNEPLSELIVYYKYSYKNDLAISNWDTANMVYGNSNLPMVQMYADTTIGFAPLMVHFSDSSLGATEWLWDFGGGNSSTEQNPVHQYPSGNIYNVSLTALLPDGYHTRFERSMIFLLADTVRGIDVFLSEPSSFEMTIRGTNAYAVSQLDMPIVYDGDLHLVFDSFSTAGCRTDYFNDVQIRHYDPANSRLTIKMKTGGEPLLQSGEGKILKLYFHTGAFAEAGQSSTILLDGYPDFDNQFFATEIEYSPFVNNGTISWNGCCVGMRGNINNDPEDLIDITDLLYLVDYSFLYPPGPIPPCFEEADMNSSGEIEITDILLLVDYMFLFPPGPNPDACPAD